MDERIEVVLAGERRVAVAVDADDLGRDALANLRLVARIGEDHQPRVRVKVDEPGRDDLAGRVDRPPCGLLFRSFAETQLPVPDLDRARPPRRPGSVHEGPANDPNLA